MRTSKAVIPALFVEISARVKHQRLNTPHGGRKKKSPNANSKRHKDTRFISREFNPVGPYAPTTKLLFISVSGTNYFAVNHFL